LDLRPGAANQPDGTAGIAIPSRRILPGEGIVHTNRGSNHTNRGAASQPVKSAHHGSSVYGRNFPPATEFIVSAGVIEPKEPTDQHERDTFRACMA
jgi:hypothetical protein